VSEHTGAESLEALVRCCIDSGLEGIEVFVEEDTFQGRDVFYIVARIGGQDIRIATVYGFREAEPPIYDPYAISELYALVFELAKYLSSRQQVTANLENKLSMIRFLVSTFSDNDSPQLKAISDILAADS
jgi:hypothetical protein